MPRIDIKLLAKELNVSTSTVSRALNNSYSISEATKEKVRRLAEKLNYEPNPYARGLVQRSSKTIAVIIPDIENSFFSSCFKGINNVADQYGYHVLIYLTHEDYKKEAGLAKTLLNGRVDGLLISVSRNTADAGHLKSLAGTIPLVMFDRVMHGNDIPKVTTDDYDCGYLATSHLIQSGARRLLYLGESPLLSTDQRRKEGFLAAVAESASVQKMEAYCLYDSKEENLSLLEKKYNEELRFDGIFASTEKLALLSYQLCEKLRISIPGDVQLTGVSNSQTSAFLQPSLTAIGQPAYEIGAKAAQVLFSMLTNKRGTDSPSHYSLKSRLIVRNSTGQTPC